MKSQQRILTLFTQIILTPKNKKQEKSNKIGMNRENRQLISLTITF
jgi:hypothetical protein